ncbi:Uncharacterised protein [Bordetella pertussis]|nr:Uncharacterised protein [Bordetella pertussis]
MAAHTSWNDGVWRDMAGAWRYATPSTTSPVRACSAASACWPGAASADSAC